MPLTKEQEQKIRDATPMDDFTIRLMLRKSPELAELICRIILQEKNLKVRNLDTQYDASRGGIARGITMDAVVEDDQGRVHNLEIQLDARGLSPERGRYHAGILDVEYLNPGEDFTKLPETFVIFICDHDPYGYGEPIYLVDRVIRSKNKKVLKEYGDRQHILYVNGEWKKDDDLGKLMHDFHCSRPEDMYYPLMAERLRYLKETPEGRMEMNGITEMIIDSTRDQVQHENAERMLKKGMDETVVAELLAMPIEYVESIKDELAYEFCHYTGKECTWP